MGGLVGISLILHEFVVYFRVLFPEATEDDITFIFPVPYVAFDGIPGYFCGSSVRITVHAGTDAREGDAFSGGGSRPFARRWRSRMPVTRPRGALRRAIRVRRYG